MFSCQQCFVFVDFSFNLMVTAPNRRVRFLLLLSLNVCLMIFVLVVHSELGTFYLCVVRRIAH